MWYFEKFDHCKSLVTCQDNYTETLRFDRLVGTWRLQIRSGRYEVGVKDVWREV